MSELQRFSLLFDDMCERTCTVLADAPAAAYTHVPIDNDVMYLGTRVNKIHIAALVRHLIIAESFWIDRLAGSDGAVEMPFPDNADTYKAVPDGPELLEAYRKMHAEARKNLATLDENNLEREVTFAGRKYSVMGFLWQLYGHHNYHMGQADLALRQYGVMPLEFMEEPKKDGVIA